MAKVFQLQPGQPPLTTGDADPDPQVVLQPTGVTFSTTARAWIRGIRSTPQLASDPADPTWRRMRVFHYEYSLLLEGGSATLKPDNTIELVAGDLYIQSKAVYDPNAQPVMIAAGQPLVLYPIVTKKVVKTGSVSTEFLVRALGLAVEVSFRSSHLAPASVLGAAAPGVWTSITQPNGNVPAPSRMSQATHARTLDQDGTSDSLAPLSAAQAARYAALRDAAHAVGVKD